MSAHGVVLFFTTSSALRAERILLDAGLTVQLIPTPREFSSDCGIACRFKWADLERVKKNLDEEAVELSDIRAMGKPDYGAGPGS